MDAYAFVIALVSLVVVAPTAIAFHYITKWKTMKTLSSDDEKLMDDLWKTAQGLERRIDALETILDKEVPDWRLKDGE